MMPVVDTNVIAYYLLGTEPFREESSAFWRGSSGAQAPASWEAEITNVLWVATRAGRLASADAVDRLQAAQGLAIASTPVRDLWHGALRRAILAGHAVYDTLFVELAARRQVPLVTFDKAVLAKFGEVALRPRDYLTGSGSGRPATACVPAPAAPQVPRLPGEGPDEA